jgi:hypothetical protein
VAGAGNGGGLTVHYGGTANLTNVTIAMNSANQGGGILSMGTLTLDNVTISGNSAATGGGIFASMAGVVIRNSILGGNTASTSGADCSGTIVSSLGHNLIQSTNGCAIVPDPTDLTGAAPGLNPLGENGGPTATMSLQPTSPALDAGDPATCAAADQRGFPRPLDGNKDGAAVCDIGAHEQGSRVGFASTAAYDGWIVESSETSAAGGAKNNKATTLRVGDDAKDRQYRSILSFDTSALPKGAFIQRADLFLKHSSVAGENPLDTHGGLRADIRGPHFGAAAALGLDDFGQKGNQNAACTFGKVALDDWYRGSCLPAAFPFINTAGTTQVRLRFSKDDNDDGGADILGIFSGNAPVTADRPRIEVYFLP